MQIRNNKVLLTLLLTTLNESDNEFSNGLCPIIGYLWRCNKTNIKEHWKLIRYINKHRPNKDSTYSWPASDKLPRIKWLKQQIKLLS